MTTQRQILADRGNAKLSTRPEKGRGRGGRGKAAVLPRHGRIWLETRRITKRTQLCAKRGTARISRRFFLDWLYRRRAKLEQEQVSGVTANLPETAIIPRVGRGIVRGGI